MIRAAVIVGTLMPSARKMITFLAWLVFNGREAISAMRASASVYQLLVNWSYSACAAVAPSAASAAEAARTVRIDICVLP
ncbi:MAG: hypothetical protein R3F55_14590 [Alphaproteobacteria bacterium]